MRNQVDRRGFLSSAVGGLAGVLALDPGVFAEENVFPQEVATVGVSKTEGSLLSPSELRRSSFKLDLDGFEVQVGKFEPGIILVYRDLNDHPAAERYDTISISGNTMRLTSAEGWHSPDVVFDDKNGRRLYMQAIDGGEITATFGGRVELTHKGKYVFLNGPVVEGGYLDDNGEKVFTSGEVRVLSNKTIKNYGLGRELVELHHKGAGRFEDGRPIDTFYFYDKDKKANRLAAGLDLGGFYFGADREENKGYFIDLGPGLGFVFREQSGEKK